MIEYSPREPHERYFFKDGYTTWVHVNNMGVVEATEELFADLMILAGYTEVTDE